MVLLALRLSFKVKKIPVEKHDEKREFIIEREKAYTANCAPRSWFSVPLNSA